MEFIWLIVGVAMGATVASFFLYIKNRGNITPEQHNELKTKYDELSHLRVELETNNRNALDRLREAEIQVENQFKISREAELGLTKASSELEFLKTKLNTQQKDIEDLHKKLTEQFENIASRIVNTNSQIFNERQSERLDQILNPLKEKIEKFETKVDQTHKENIRDNESLKEQLKLLQTMNQTIGEEAKNLTSALKGQSKVQGDWGEYILESILEKSGLVKGREYHKQVSMTTEEGNRIQPDFVINLPDNKNLVIDSKVSLVAYERYCNAESEKDRALAFAEHLASVKKHIKDLSSKNYQQLYQLQSLDFVVMFIPVEPAFSVAVQADMNLFSEAYEKNIVLVCPSTLLATVRTVASIWRQEYQNRNALEIARQSGDLYDKFVGFLNDMSDLGDRIKKSHDSYDNAMKKLAEGRGNLISKAEKIRELGARTSKNIPSRLLENVNDDELTDSEQL